ncbi:class I SAM-dependent methyltransferase [Streptomyces roseicoloratus]|uniref:Methyltransferase domain-containing protein n=1 Tax=Streptomyces roseicoloratus TaxID=2508722 RepID=A0ABY9RZK8_9ACTN|nr:methyltransferase domain-containing protein [Streptomyces roseicoloratus]WMX47602.1 methyltransferase domain-containing protein [Streptomyces roseicoloratus]
MGTSPNPHRKRYGHDGSGPGPITPDGCAVDLYRRLSVGTEPEVIAAALPAGASLLELGSGAGRVTAPLAARGFAVTAVDESAEMLAVVGERVPGVETVLSPIEDLRLDRRFDAVVLGSFLVHTADPRTRQGFLETCRRHVTDDGHVLVQREGADYHDAVPRERHDPAGYTVRIVSCDPVGDGVDRVLCEYVFPDARWTQTFLSRRLTTADFEEHLREAGLVVERYLTDDGIWVLARPAGNG